MTFAGGSAAAFGLVVLAGCTGSLQGPPDLVEAYGTVDEPCAASNLTIHCSAHVYMVNHGAEGAGKATIVVPLTSTNAAATSARTASAATCDISIPDIASGSAVDLVCNFELPPGKAIASVPSIQDLNVTAAASTDSSTSGTSGIATFGLAVVATFLGLVTVLAAIRGRRRQIPAAENARTEDEERGEEEDRTW